MELTLLTIRFHLEGCRSLKEKRQRLAGLKTRIGQRPEYAIIESDLADALQSAQWSVAVVSHSAAGISRSLSQLETWVQEGLDATVTHWEAERL